MACLPTRFARLAVPAPKFDRTLGAEYARARVHSRAGHAGCPPHLVWSDYSELFRILPWWESDGPVTKVALPDHGRLKKIKPSVAFQVPASIANLLRGDMTKLKDGEGSTAGSTSPGCAASRSRRSRSAPSSSSASSCRCST